MPVKKILIAGGSGLIGKMLTEHFLLNGHTVNILSRQEDLQNHFFYWDPAKEIIDDEALRDVTCVINLGGISLADGRWTLKRKQEIVNSRIQSTDFLFHKLKTIKHSVESFISASAVGYYGNRGDEWIDESFSSGEDFLSTCCRYWEESALKMSSLGIQTTIFRIGIVLSKNGGALPLLAMPVKLFVGATLGNGKQFISWIHHTDLCNMFLKAAESNAMNGIYNAVSPEPLTNRSFMKTLAQVFHRPFFLPPVPEWLLNLILGQKAITVTGGQRISCKKVLDTGFTFQFPALRSALKNIYRKNM